MSYLHCHFETHGFSDSAATRAENINDISGHELAAWVAARLSEAGFDVSNVWPEDHGWDFDASQDEQSYLLACSLAETDDGEPSEAHIVIRKSRSLIQWLRGENKIDHQDRLVRTLRKVLERHDDITAIEFDIS